MESVLSADYRTNAAPKSTHVYMVIIYTVGSLQVLTEKQGPHIAYTYTVLLVLFGNCIN